MPPKLKHKELIDAVLDKRILDAIAANTSVFTALIVEKMLNKKLDGLLHTISKLKRENTVLKGAVSTSLSTSNADMVEVTFDLKKRLEDIEAYSRRENLIIRGLPEGSFVESATRSDSLSSACDERQIDYLPLIACTRVIKSAHDPLLCGS